MQPDAVKNCFLRVHISDGGRFGHAGFSLVDPQGQETFYDFQQKNGNTLQRTSKSAFRRAVANALWLAFPIATIALYASVGTALTTDMGTAAKMLGGLAGGYMGVAVWPTVDTVTAHSKPSYPDARSHTIPITEHQYKQACAYIKKRTFYSLAVHNCSTYTRNLMDACGIQVPLRHLFNTPKFLEKGVQSYLATQQQPSPTVVAAL